jgi:hypothetical protein
MAPVAAGPGSQVWVARYHGPGNGNDAAFSVPVSPAGRAVFVTERSGGTTSGFDHATVAYNAATGAQEWVARYHGPVTHYNEDRRYSSSSRVTGPTAAPAPSRAPGAGVPL